MLTTVPKEHLGYFQKVMKAWEATDPAMTIGFLLKLVREEQVWHIVRGKLIYLILHVLSVST